MAKLFKTVVVVSLVFLFSTPAFSQLLISQYYEGTSQNKWIEIKNPGPGSVNTSTGWTLTLWSNANTEAYKTGGIPSATMDLSGLPVLAAGDVVLLSHGSATVPGYATADVLNSSVVNFNGDDSVVLYESGTIIDVVGFTDSGAEGLNTSWVRSDPGPGWNTTPGSNVTDFPTIWTEFTNAAVEGATAGDEEYLGSSTVPVELQGFTIE